MEWMEGMKESRIIPNFLASTVIMELLFMKQERPDQDLFWGGRFRVVLDILFMMPIRHSSSAVEQAVKCESTI